MKLTIATGPVKGGAFVAAGFGAGGVFCGGAAGVVGGVVCANATADSSNVIKINKLPRFISPSIRNCKIRGQAREADKTSA